MSAGVIVGYDGSACAKEAVRVAVEVAKTYGDKVIIVFAYQLNPVTGEMHDYHAALKDLATQRLHEATELVSSTEGVEIEPAIVERVPAQGLVELAQARDARMIVVGTHGESPLKGVLVGSTPYKLVQIADRPVLVVPLRDG
jgi:nucleotide-binding universal stress UspA family protein